MLNSTFAFWREPGKEYFFNLKDPVIYYVNEPDLGSEGFYISPFDTNARACFIKGAIEVCHKLPEIIFNGFDKSKSDYTSSINYSDLVKKAIDTIKQGKFHKVVLARKSEENLPVNFSLAKLLDNLSKQFPKALIYCIGLENEIWLGASPEILVQKETLGYITFALAGTKIPGSKGSFGEKEIHEQAVVKDYILESLVKNQTTDISVSPLIEYNTGNLLHLLNEITFNSKNVLPILKGLHPTPAVCGYPLKAAKDFIISNEGVDRSYYSGYLGPIKPNGQFSFWVNLRCAKLIDNKITFYAGAGILADSDPQSEFLETEKKMDTLRTPVFQ